MQEKVCGTGLKKKTTHRSQWPKYYRKNIPEKELIWLELGRLYDERGTRVTESEEESITFISRKPCMVFIRSLRDKYGISLCHQVTVDETASVIATKEGNPICARAKAGRSTSWIVSQQSWIDTRKVIERESRNGDLCEGMEGFLFLREIRELYRYYGIGMYPTPGSLGQAHMTQVHAQHNFKKHTALSLAAEDFIQKHSVGGIVITPGLHMKFPVAYQLDLSSAYVAHWTKHPDGTAVKVDEHSDLDQYATYFVQCTVIIPYDLPLGVFPRRLPKKNRRRVDYPTLAGVYRNVYLWKEQIEDCRKKGLLIHPIAGYGWRCFTEEGSPWSKEAYAKRVQAPTKFIQDLSKKINVAAIGYHGMGRTHFVLVSESQRLPEDVSLINSFGEPVNIFIRKEIDTSSAHLNHWHRYTIMQCNRSVQLFAWQFAEQERLVMIDYDGIVVTQFDKNKFYLKGSESAKKAPAGSWIYTQLHNLEVVNHRSYRSDEQTKTPGVSAVL